MRKYFNFTIDQIASCLDGLMSGSPEYAECLSELRHRNSKKAKVLLAKYERAGSLIKLPETAPSLISDRKVGDSGLSQRMARIVESYEKLLSQQEAQFGTLIALIPSASQTSATFGLPKLESEEQTLSELGWAVNLSSLPRHEFLFKKFTQRNFIMSFFFWMLGCRLEGYASQSAANFVLTPEVAEKITPAEKEAALAYINQKKCDGPEFSSTRPIQTSAQRKQEVPVHYLPGFAPPKKKTPYEIWQERRREEEVLKQWTADEPNRMLRNKDMWDELDEFNRESDLYREELSGLTTNDLKERWQAREWESEIEMNVLKAVLRSRVL